MRVPLTITHSLIDATHCADHTLPPIKHGFGGLSLTLQSITLSQTQKLQEVRDTAR